MHYILRSTVVVAAQIGSAACLAQNPSDSVFEAMDASLSRLLDNFATAQAKLTPRSTATTTEKKAYEDISNCGSMLYASRREISGLQRLVSLRGYITESAGKDLADRYIKQQRNSLTPVLAGSITELFAISARSGNQDVKRVCKEAAEFNVFALQAVAEMATPGGK